MWLTKQKKREKVSVNKKREAYNNATVHYVKLQLSHLVDQQTSLRIKDHFIIPSRCRRLDVILV